MGLVPPDLDRAGIRTRAFVTANIVPSEAIIKAIRRFAPDLVVMASQGANAADPENHGMTTEDVIWNSPKPVVVVPAIREQS